MKRIYEMKLTKSNFPRFKPIKRDMSPSPSSYRIEESKNHVMNKTIKYSLGKGNRETFVDFAARKNKSPGVVRY